MLHRTSAEHARDGVCHVCGLPAATVLAQIRYADLPVGEVWTFRYHEACAPTWAFPQP